MGHLAIVTPSTITRTNNNHPYISYKGTLGDKIYKTIADLFSDALVIRNGDIIFTWCVNEKGKKGFGFERYFIADGTVLFDPSDAYPIKIGVKEGYKYDIPVSEERALDLFLPNLLWNAIGKKSLGRGRSLTHQTRYEDDILISLLESENIGRPKTKIIDNPRYLPSLQHIEINNFSFTQTNPQQIGIQTVVKGKTQTLLNTIPIQNIIWNSGNQFCCEKALEAYLCANIDNNSIIDFCTMVNHPECHIKWIGNYLPYGVQGSSIDMVVEIGNDNEHYIEVIELKDDTLGYKKYQYEVDYQILSYQKFIEKAFLSFVDTANVESVLITHTPTRIPRVPNVKYKNVKWIGYNIDQCTNTVIFNSIFQ